MALPEMGADVLTQNRRALVAITGILSLVASVATQANAYPRPGSTERMVSTSGEAAHFPPSSDEPSAINSPMKCTVSSVNNNGMTDITPNGRYVAFASYADNLVDGDTNEACDIFVRDRLKGTTERVSVASDGTQAEMQPLGLLGLVSSQPSISANGRYIAFTSNATNLWMDGTTVAPADTNLASDVYVHDRVEKVTRLVSVSELSLAGVEHSGTGASGSPSINANGRYIAFTSAAPDLVAEDLRGGVNQWDIFVRDMKESNTTLASSVAEAKNPTFVLCEGADVDGGGDGETRTGGFSSGSTSPSISADGQTISFITDLAFVSEDTNNGHDIYVKHMETGKFERASVRSDGHQIEYHTYCGAPFDSGQRQMSADGRVVLFSTAAFDLIPSDTNGISPLIGSSDIFTHDMDTGRTERVSVTSAGVEGDHGSYSPSISPNGRYIVFDGTADNLGPDAGTDTNVFLHDRKYGTTELIPIREVATNYRSTLRCPETFRAGSVSGDGSDVTLSACSPDLVADGEAEGWDSFVRSRGQDMGTEVQVMSGQRSNAGVVSKTDPTGDALHGRGDEADLIGLELAYRETEQDLFVVQEVEKMDSLLGPLSASPMLYGMDLSVGDRSYQVRVSSLPVPTFELYQCASALTCSKVTDLEGGYGTTGERVVYSLPLDVIGFQDGGLSRVKAYSALGTTVTGPINILDRIAIGAG